MNIECVGTLLNNLFRISNIDCYFIVFKNFIFILTNKSEQSISPQPFYFREPSNQYQMKLFNELKIEIKVLI